MHPESVSYRVRDLAPEQRQAVESLMGRRLEEGERIFVKADVDRVVKEAATGEERVRAFEEIAKICRIMEENSRGTPPEEMDEIIAEAIEFVRRNPE
ncbi:MAG: hypothetical protein U0Q16_12650 [Bryobacteraceae bacterium]